MASFRWLHFTDLHCGMSGIKGRWSNVESLVFRDLEKMREASGPWDVLFFTGDLVQKGAAAEFAQLNRVLGRLYRKLRELDSEPKLLAVPGNHDLNRPDRTKSDVRLLIQWTRQKDVQNDFWKTPDSPYRKVIGEAFKEYENWWNNHPFPRPASIRKGDLPGDIAATIEKESFQIGVLGLNAAFLQLTEGNYKRKLALSRLQMAAACGEDYQDWFNANHANFLLTHQPPDWLWGEAAKEFNAEISIPGRFVAHLFGHMHEYRAYTTSSTGALPKREWQGLSLFGLETYGETKPIDRRHGYAAGTLTLGTDAEVRLWPRKAVETTDGNLQIIRAAEATLEKDEGTAPEKVKLNAVLSAVAVPALRATFKVLLLSTEKDLAAARKSIATHLRSALGVEVVEESSKSAGDWDAAVLLQGWCWEKGAATAAWKEAQAAAKLAFLVDEDSDWPPRSLTELTAQEDIEKFRKELKAKTLFKNPAELPQKVGESITALVQKRTGLETTGLTKYERAYLRFRGQAWSMGRTTRSRAYLLESEQTGEPYRPDLYIPLFAQSQGWIADNEGNPVVLVEPPKKSKGEKQEKASGPKETRVSVGKWFTAPELPAIALVGTPGSGKTTVLTRVAFALGSACLGSPVELEPDLDLVKLREQTGSLPIPVVLEATRLQAAKSSTIQAIVELIADEMKAGGGQPNEKEIANGLENGRYLLLVDALDEIPDWDARTQALDLLKGMTRAHPKTRLIVTSRMATYTGVMAFEPAIKIVELAPLKQEQITLFCAKWTAYRKRDDEYRKGLEQAIAAISEQVTASAGDQTLTENPLMLTAVCMVFERHRRLPDDRGSLCDLLIDDLCRSRTSKDEAHGWRLDDAQKKDLLQRIALEMQKEGAQSWPVEKAVTCAIDLVPQSELQRRQARQFVDWASEHTGLLRFEQSQTGAEHVRFWHRLFREYLAAHRLAQLDTTVSDKVDELWTKKYLLNPFWEDVVRLFPRALGTVEKARSLREALEKTAADHKEKRGRLLGLVMGAIIESRDLFPDVAPVERAQQLAELYEREANGWDVNDRVLFLEGLGRLDPVGGDPRFHEPKWVELPSGTAIGWAPVTVQEFRTFWESEALASKVKGRLKELERYWRSSDTFFRRQYRHPNWPVQVLSGMAEQYSEWLTKIRADGRTVDVAQEVHFAELLRKWPPLAAEKWKVEIGWSLFRPFQTEFSPVGAKEGNREMPVGLRWAQVPDVLSFGGPFRCVLLPPGVKPSKKRNVIRSFVNKSLPEKMHVKGHGLKDS